MKRIRLLILLCAVAVVLPLGLVHGVAKATGTTNQVTIQSNADYDFVGTNLDVGLYVRCSGGTGTVAVTVSQSPPQTPYPVGEGSGPQIVVCDGQTHSVGVTIVGAGFDAGRAWATADLTTATLGTAHAGRWINIIVV